MNALEIRASVWLSAIFALRMLGLFLILPVFAVYAQTLPGGDNPALVGLALGMYGLTQACLQIPFGMASDRFGRKPVITIGLLIFAVGSFIAAFSPNIYITIFGRAVQGAGAISAAVTAMIADATREEHRTKAMALVGASIALVFAASLIGAPALYAQIGMLGLFCLIGALSLIAIVVLQVLVPNVPIPHVAAADKVPFSAVLHNPELLRLNFGIFALHLTQMAMFVVVPLALVQHLGLPVAQHWKVYLPVVLASFVLMLPPIFIGEKKGVIKPVFLSAIALMAVVQIGLAFYFTHSTALIILLLAFFVAFNILEANLPSLVSRLAPPAAKGAALGIYNTLQALGLFVGGALGGWLVKHVGNSAVFYLGGGMMLAWLLLASKMQPISKRVKAPAASKV